MDYLKQHLIITDGDIQSKPHELVLAYINVTKGLNEVELADVSPPDGDFDGAYLREADLDEADLTFARFKKANLSKASLLRANFFHAHLEEAILEEARLERAFMEGARLCGAKLRSAQLAGANLQTANFNGADLREADLSKTDLRWADLQGADLRGASLYQANLQNANLEGARAGGANFACAVFVDSNLVSVDFTCAKFGATVLASTNLTGAIGLDKANHLSRSTLGIDTFFESRASIGETFLRGVGAPDPFVEYAKSLVGMPIERYSAFISYSSKDEDFAKRLYADLQEKGVRCWLASEDLEIGAETRSTIDETIHNHDKLLLILSENSVQSSWVKKEVETAFEKEQEQGRLMLFPIRIDDAVMRIKVGWAADIRRSRNIGDFTEWKNHAAYQKAFDRLLRNLKSNKPPEKAKR